MSEQNTSIEDKIRQEAKALKIKNWHNKKIEILRQEVLDAKAMNSDNSPVTYEQDEEETTSSESKAREFEKSIKSKEKMGNRGFIEASKEEALYPFPNKKGDRIGLWRRVNFDVYIRPYDKDTSFKFVCWQDEHEKRFAK